MINADADDTIDGIQIRYAPGSSFSATVRGNSVRAVCEGAVEDCTFTINTEEATDSTKQKLTASPFTFTAVALATGKPANATAGAWIFKAISQRSIAIPGGDQEFMYFGWWIQTPDSAEGNYMYMPRYGGGPEALLTSFPTSDTFPLRRLGHRLVREGRPLEDRGVRR